VKNRRSPNLNRRQAALLAATAVLCAAVAGGALTGHPAVTLIALGFFQVVVIGVLLVLIRRLAGVLAVTRANRRDMRQVMEQTQRRMLAAVEELLLASGDRHRELTEAVAVQQKAAATGTDRLLRAQNNEVEAMVQLFQWLTPRAPMPPSGGFALNPTDLLDLLHLVRLRKPRLVVELGSGTSSVWLGYALEQYGGKLVSFDHDGDYARQTRSMLAAHGLNAVAEVRDAPLRELTVDGSTYQWYDVDQLRDLIGINLLVVDGPPAATGPDARYPALQVLEAKLSPTATVVLDDANRPDEQDAVRRWTENVTGLTSEPHLIGRHAVMAYSRTGSPVSV